MEAINRITLNAEQYICVQEIIGDRSITGIEFIFDRLDPSMPHVVCVGLEGVPIEPGYPLAELWHVYASGAAPLKRAVLYQMPYSEVCCHMQIAGTQQWLETPGSGLQQIVTLQPDGRVVNFSGPITFGEAGLHLGPKDEVF
jgi:hypothetical protein